MAFVIAPELFTVKRMNVQVEMASPLAYGQTVCDLYDLGRRPESEKNVNVAMKMDVPAFWALMLGALAQANAVSSLNF